VKPHHAMAERTAKWEADLARIETDILRNRRWGETRRFAARAGWNRHQRRKWLIEHIADAKAQEGRRDSAPFDGNVGSSRRRRLPQQAQSVLDGWVNPSRSSS